MPLHSIENVQLDPSLPPRRKRAGVSVRVLMLLVLVFGVWLARYAESVRRQQEAVDAIRRAGGSVTYDWQWDHYNPDILDYSGRYRAPRWLARWVGVDYVANVVSVRLGSYARNDVSADDTTLARLAPLQRLEELAIGNVNITDRGLPHLTKLTRLRQLSFQQTPIGDVGIAHIHGVASLRYLVLCGTPISDESVLAIEKAIPALQVWRDDDSIDSGARSRALKDLGFARSQPIRQSRLLLTARAELMAGRNNPAEFIATVDALCDLEASDTLNLVRLAEQRAYCLGLLESDRSPRVSASDRQRLQKRCRARAVAALSKAVDMGYDNVRRLDGECPTTGLDWLRNDPAYRQILGRMKAKGTNR